MNGCKEEQVLTSRHLEFNTDRAYSGIVATNYAIRDFSPIYYAYVTFNDFYIRY